MACGWMAFVGVVKWVAAGGARVPSSRSSASWARTSPAQRGEPPRSWSRAAVRWNFAAPDAANFQNARLCGVALGLCRAWRGQRPRRRAVRRRVWDFAAPPPGGCDALSARTRAEKRGRLRWRNLHRWLERGVGGQGPHGWRARSRTRLHTCRRIGEVDRRVGDAGEDRSIERGVGATHHAVAGRRRLVRRLSGLRCDQQLPERDRPRRQHRP